MRDLAGLRRAAITKLITEKGKKISIEKISNTIEPPLLDSLVKNLYIGKSPV